MNHNYLPNAPELTINNKLDHVAELFKLDVLSEDEALKACKVIIGQHAKVKDKTEEGGKIVSAIK